MVERQVRCHSLPVQIHGLSYLEKIRDRWYAEGCWQQSIKYFLCTSQLQSRLLSLWAGPGLSTCSNVSCTYQYFARGWGSGGDTGDIRHTNHLDPGDLDKLLTQGLIFYKEIEHQTCSLGMIFRNRYFQTAYFS